MKGLWLGILVVGLSVAGPAVRMFVLRMVVGLTFQPLRGLFFIIIIPMLDVLQGEDVSAFGFSGAFFYTMLILEMGQSIESSRTSDFVC